MLEWTKNIVTIVLISVPSKWFAVKYNTPVNATIVTKRRANGQIGWVGFNSSLFTFAPRTVEDAIRLPTSPQFGKNRIQKLT